MACLCARSSAPAVVPRHGWTVIWPSRAFLILKWHSVTPLQLIAPF